MFRLRAPSSLSAILGLLLLPAGFETAAAQDVTPPYWIVSTRGCPQRPNQVLPGTCPRVFKADGLGPTVETTMRDMVATLDPQRPIVVFVHGSYMTKEGVLRDSPRVFRWLHRAAPEDVEPQYVAFTWPSTAVTIIAPSIDVNVLGRRAEFNGYYLARLVRSLPAGAPVTLVGHSHGTRVVAGAMQLRGQGVLQGFQLPPTKNEHAVKAVFLAAAIDEHWFDPAERYGRAWDGMDGLLHLRNDRDSVLNVYALRRPFAKRALGKVGFESRRAQLGPAATRFTEVDVSAQVGSGHLIASYTTQPAIARRIGTYLASKPKPSTKPSEPEPADDAPANPPYDDGPDSIAAAKPRRPRVRTLPTEPFRTASPLQDIPGPPVATHRIPALATPTSPMPAKPSSNPAPTSALPTTPALSTIPPRPTTETPLPSSTPAAPTPSSSTLPSQPVLRAP